MPGEPSFIPSFEALRDFGTNQRVEALVRRPCDVAATVTGERIARAERLKGGGGKVDGKGSVGFPHIYIYSCLLET